MKLLYTTIIVILDARSLADIFEHVMVIIEQKLKKYIFLNIILPFFDNVFSCEILAKTLIENFSHCRAIGYKLWVNFRTIELLKINMLLILNIKSASPSVRGVVPNELKEKFCL